MNPARRAVIDIGTNSVKLLVAEVAGGEVRPLLEQSHQTRLGRGFYQTHRLQPEPIAQTAAAAAEFAGKARGEGAASIRVIATSAARDAVNAAELIAAVNLSTGLTMEIISGEQEADWAFQGVTTDAELAQHALLLLDIGGGSTEFILGHRGHKHFSRSFSLGTVRLLEQHPPSDPPTAAQLTACRDWVWAFLDREVEPRIRPVLSSEPAYAPAAGDLLLVGTGGTASILGCMAAKLTSFSRTVLEQTRISRSQLQERVEELWSLSLEQRRHLVGLPPNRADVILTGAVIFAVIMERFAIPQLRLSTRGLRFAAVMAEASN
jgi:exopolyphosphatase / guanosine-5'-triphosphate,3'-diphosphate pyrophosphatase